MKVWISLGWRGGLRGIEYMVFFVEPLIGLNRIFPWTLLRERRVLIFSSLEGSWGRKSRRKVLESGLSLDRMMETWRGGENGGAPISCVGLMDSVVNVERS